MNPDDVTQEYLADIKSLGITRASMGVQSFNPKLLTFMHRAHNRQEALKSLELLAIGNLPSFSVDLIYGNPGQSLQMLEQDIQTLLSFSPPHISAYSLTIEPRTRLGKQFDLGRLIPKENDEVAQHYDMVYEMLKNNGIAQYEVSNYAKPGSEALHNSAYWNHQNYLGFGPAAHSYWWGESKQWAKRWTGSKTLNTYLKGGWEKMHHLEKLNQTTLAEERLMLGLRTVAGLKISELGFLYGYRISEKQKTYLKRLQSDAKVNLSDDQIQLTSKGLRVSDSIILDLLSC
jgi:oxygen-independent coproporphyrinogen-3 oxidase